MKARTDSQQKSPASVTLSHIGESLQAVLFMRRFLPICLAGGVLLQSATPPATPLEKTVIPVLKANCAGCHNEKLTSGSLNITSYLQPGPLAPNREGWERIVAKLRTGEMPPRGLPRPTPGDVDTVVKYVEGELERADRALKPNPGRLVARRLNRAEYENTIRDLLGVHFQAREEFPPDDSGNGFDNMGAVLTVSPVLMEKYLSAAEKIAARAIGADPLPKPGLFAKRNRIKRLDTSIIEFTDGTDYDAEYTVRTLIIGHRGPEGKPVTLVVSVDGKPVKTTTLESALTQVTKQAAATQRVSVDVRVHLSEGPHTFRAAFIDDVFPKDLPRASKLNNSRNMFPDSMEIAGPFPSAEERPSRKRILACDPALGAPCVERILTALAHRAYRRPVTRDEVTSLVGIYDRARAAQYAPDQSVQFAIAAMLVSPQFLFRIERDPAPGTIAKISNIDLASRLSYFLWSSMPDDELTRLAEQGRLRSPAVLDAQVKRMLADPKAEALAENFGGQWLETRSLDAVKPDPAKFSDWGPETRDAMKTETRLFLQSVIRDNRPISDFIDGKYSYLNDRLATLYGISGVTGPDFRRVELTGDQRSGVFTQASVLTVSSYPSRTSVVLRGKYLLENVLGSPPPPPPAVPALDEADIGVGRSLRQQMETHRSNAACASCHARMDPLGFGLENYDAIGRWRNLDGKFPVDASGTFPNGHSFTTPTEMKALLLTELPEFNRCLTVKMMTYALGRGMEDYDRIAIRDVISQTAEADYKFQSMISAIVHSLPFQSRQGLPTGIQNNKVEVAKR